MDQEGRKHLLRDQPAGIFAGIDGVAGGAVVVLAGTYHNVINASRTEPLKLYTVYAPPEHSDGTVHKTKAEADAAEHH